MQLLSILHNCKKIICFFLCILLFFPNLTKTMSASEAPPDSNSLHALSACLMDADSGRILYDKEAHTFRANASTTKILTCILALEYGNLSDYVTVSKYAASMPDVQLGINTGEQYLLKDLLYSLMLESHNDSAVAIAEHIGGSVEEFSAMMNEKAAQLGCSDSFFLTPNGLDATKNIDGKEYSHGTTAADLCKIMAYCIKNPAFLQITQTASYSFTNYITDDTGNTINGSRSFTVNNKNAFLSMMDGILSGKTGFTGAAGYCYVTALQKDGKTFTLALLASGWPGNKTYKWEDAKKLLNYGLSAYAPKDIFDYDMALSPLPVTSGITDSVPLKISQSPLVSLISDTDEIKIDCEIPREIKAPVHNGDRVGFVTYTINGEVVSKYPVCAAKTVKRFTFSYCLKKAFSNFLL